MTPQVPIIPSPLPSRRDKVASELEDTNIALIRQRALQRKKEEARQAAPLFFRGRESEGLEKGQKCFIN
jgi:hypothetical protein